LSAASAASNAGDDRNLLDRADVARISALVSTAEVPPTSTERGSPSITRITLGASWRNGKPRWLVAPPAK
jgi:hypothetical protein